LRDKILRWADANGRSRSDPALRRIQQFANGVVLTSQGIPFLHAGVALMRDKQGDHNTYKSGDGVNAIRWQWKTDHADIFRYYKAAMALRRAHPGLRLTSWDAIDRPVTTTTPRHEVVMSPIRAGEVGDDWSEILVVANSADNDQVPLPPGMAGGHGALRSSGGLGAQGARQRDRRGDGSHRPVLGLICSGPLWVGLQANGDLAGRRGVRAGGAGGAGVSTSALAATSSVDSKVRRDGRSAFRCPAMSASGSGDKQCAKRPSECRIRPDTSR